MKIRNRASGGWHGLFFGFPALLLLQENPFPAQLLYPAGSSSQSRRWVGCWKIFQHWRVHFAGLELGTDNVGTQLSRVWAAPWTLINNGAGHSKSVLLQVRLMLDLVKFFSRWRKVMGTSGVCCLPLCHGIIADSWAFCPHAPSQHPSSARTTPCIPIQ